MNLINPAQSQTASQNQAVDLLARQILVRGSVTRADLSRETGYCAASVTNHTRWLLKHRFLKARNIRVPQVKRPVHELSVNGERGAALLIRMDRHHVACEVIGLDTSALVSFSRPVREPTQRWVLAALSESVAQTHQWLLDHHHEVDLAGMEVNGSIAAEDGMIFGVDGVEHWKPCQPRLVLPAMSFIKVLHLWTRVMSKMRGFATRHQREDQTCYVEFLNTNFHVATMRQNEVFFGKHGSTSAFLHQSVVPDGPVCYCGRRGCLASLVEAGHIEVELISAAFIRFLQHIEVKTVALEWEHDRDSLALLLEGQGFEVFRVEDGLELAGEGLRTLTAQSAMSRAIASAGS